jgi:uncharacterized membrane protein
MFLLRQGIRGSLWFVPLLGGLAGVVVGQLAIWAEPLLTLPAAWQYRAGAAQGLLTAIVGAMISLLGLVVAIGVLVVQIATGTLSPRFMRLWYRDRLQKFVLATFVGTITLAFSLLRQVSAEQVPILGVSVAGLGVLASLVLLLLYLNRFAHYLRPVGMGAEVARRGLREARKLTHLAGRHRTDPDAGAIVTGQPAAVVRVQRGGIIQAINIQRLITLAERHDCVFVLGASVGDFIPIGSQVVSVHTTGHGPDNQALLGLFALGDERTIDDDPGFALRILVDVAIRALSPTVNDPTTAVQILDHVEVLLFELATLVETGDRLVLHDRQNRPRLLIPARGFVDYLQLAVTEIRQYGGRSTQVCRRLTVLLEALREAVPPHRRAVVDAEIAKLGRTVATHFTDAEELAFARTGDRQGIGGPR